MSFEPGKYSTKNEKVKNHFTIGDAKFKVIGAVGPHKIYKKENGKLIWEQKGYYTNNMSLVTIVSCGGIKYLTAGDIFEVSKNDGKNYTDGEELKLAKKYKNNKEKLKCDIMKLSHNGHRNATYRSNCDKLLKLVKPDISFVSASRVSRYWEKDTSNDKYKDKKGHAQAFNSIRNAQVYGFCYCMRDTEKHFIIKITNGKINLFEKPMGGERKQLTGLLKLPSIYRTKNNKNKLKTAYYINKDYNKNSAKEEERHLMLKNEWKSIGKQIYYFGKRGGTLSGFREIGKHKYYFIEEGFAFMGFREIGKHKYYFGNKGYALTGFQKIGTYRYYFTKEGYMVKSNNKDKPIKKTIDNQEHYFDYKGRECDKNGKTI